MEILLAVLFLYGCAYALREGGKAASRAYRSRPPATRHDDLGWWAGEALKGFPHFRHGFARGWNRHSAAVLARRHDLEGDRASGAIHRAGLKSEIAQYQAARKAAASPPGPGQPPAAPGPGAPPLPSGHPGAPPPGHDPGPDVTDIPVRVNRPRPDDWLTLELIRLLQQVRNQATGEPDADPPPGNGRADKEQENSTMPTNTGGGDANLEMTKQVLTALITAAEATVSSREAEDGIRLADQLPAMIPDDADTLGLATDLAGYLQQAGKLQAQIQETATAMRERVSKTYDETQDAVDASGVRAPDPSFLDH